MATGHQFEHLPLLLRYRGRAKLRGGGTPAPQTTANRGANRAAHSTSLRASAQSLSANWRTQGTQRQAQDLPLLPAGKPILVEVDPGLDLDVLRDKFAFEIVAEQDEGFVLVASEDTHGVGQDVKARIRSLAESIGKRCSIFSHAVGERVVHESHVVIGQLSANPRCKSCGEKD